MQLSIITASFCHIGKGHFSESVDGKIRHSLFLPVPDDYKLPTD